MGMREGVVLQWLKSEGDRVEEGEPLVEVEAEKVSQTIAAPSSGVLLQILVPADTTVPVRSVLAVIDNPQEGFPRGSGRPVG
jgi:pyruvate/2-oxoglutarate dehydrogenase complex dihydrolipoamide acyltransferase (E2) component